jgi:imidazole glycerol phosphate synthase subunit HisF
LYTTVIDDFYYKKPNKATKEKRGPDFKLLENIANECFMPLAYGGGLKSFKDIHPSIIAGVDYILECTQERKNPRPSKVIKIGLDSRIEIIRG